MLTSVLSVLLAAAAAQVPPSPTPAQEIAERDLPRIGVETELVQLDVVVTDGQGRPVTDLRQDSFELLEDGRPRPLTHFAPGFTVTPAPTPAAAPPSGQAVPSPPPTPEAVPRARYLILAVDDYHLEPAEVPYVQRALRRFIDGQLVAGDQAMVVAASGSLGALQQFTADREVLRHAVDRLRPQSRSHRPSPLDVPRLTAYQAELIERGDQEALSMAVEEIMATEPAARQNLLTVSRHEQSVRTMARQIVALTGHVTSLTLTSLDRLVEGLRPIRGRKVVALFSSGFFLGPERESEREDLQAIADVAARSGVVFYTIDSRGLTSAAPIADASVGGGTNIRGPRSKNVVAVTPGTRSRIELRGVDAARDGLSALALDTGGLAFFDHNEPEAALQRVVEDSAVYYRLGFEPQESPRDGRFHKIEVRVPGRPGLKVRAASGYFARGRAPAASAAAPAEGTEQVTQMLRTALDSPYPLRGLPMDLTVDYMASDAGDVLAATVWLDGTRLPFEPGADGRQSAAFDIVGVVVDEEGKPKDQFSDRVELSLTAEAKDRAVRNGLTYRKTLAVTSGLLQARVAVRADKSGQLGSASQWVEVPDRTRAGLALSSILLLGEGQARPAAPPGGRGSVSFDRPEEPAVSRRFPRDGHLDYVLVVYGSGPAKAAAPADVVVESELLSGSTVLTRSPAAPVPAEGPGGLPMISGRLRLDPLPAGDYELRLVVSDRAAGSTATRSLRFTVG